jgi:hypothetical protein
MEAEGSYGLRDLDAKDGNAKNIVRPPTTASSPKETRE